MLALLRLQGHAPQRITLLGMVPATLDYALGLSPLLAARLPTMLEALVGELTAAGVIVHARQRAP